MLTLRYHHTSTAPTREISVPMPRSWAELQHTAAQQFGHGGCLRLYHQGTSLLYHPMQLKQLQDGDCIAVHRCESHRPITPADSPKVLTTTFQSSYQKHVTQRPKLGVGADYQSCLTDRMKGSMQGMSRYAADFVKHPLSPRVAFKPPSAIEMHNEPMGTTSYSREYTFHKDAIDAAHADHTAVRASSLLLASPQGAFEGCSNYTDNFKWHANSQREAAMTDSTSSVQPPPSVFSGMTTYNSNFQNCSGVERQRICKPLGKAVFESSEAPFDGTSEYRNQYHERPLTWR